mmetsp:Transcript_30777/g.65061  ORF Transcript_30777/g.65061 Transcript_30777/m.65061 type:complete len:189 (+) Transcript_30777:3-569(+)
MKSVHEVCRCICATIDNEEFDQLCDLVPNFARLFPTLSPRRNTQDQGEISSIDKVGSANKRRNNLFRLLLKSLCSAGYPVILSLDDLQWSQSFVIDGMAEFIVNYMNSHDTPEVSDETHRRGLLFVGTFRSDEVKESDVLIERINYIKQSGKANVAMLTVGELTEVDVTKLISAKLETHTGVSWTCPQ